MKVGVGKSNISFDGVDETQTTPTTQESSRHEKSEYIPYIAWRGLQATLCAFAKVLPAVIRLLPAGNFVRLDNNNEKSYKLKS